MSGVCRQPDMNAHPSATQRPGDTARLVFAENTELSLGAQRCVHVLSLPSFCLHNCWTSSVWEDQRPVTTLLGFVRLLLQPLRYFG